MDEDTLLLLGAGVLAYMLFTKNKTTVPAQSVYHSVPPVYGQPVYQYPGQQQQAGLLLPLIQKLFQPGTPAQMPVSKPPVSVPVPVSTNSQAPNSSTSSNNPANDPFLGIYDNQNAYQVDTTDYGNSNDLSTGFDAGSVYDDLNY